MIFNGVVQLGRAGGKIYGKFHTSPAKVKFLWEFLNQVPQRKVEFLEPGLTHRSEVSGKKISDARAEKKGVLSRFVLSRWVWDTFAEPNNYKQCRVKPLNKIRPHPDTYRDLAQKAG